MKKKKSPTEFRLWMDKNGWTIEVFARDIGVSYGTIAALASQPDRKPHRLVAALIEKKHPNCPLLRRK